ncbi:MAG: hypothetical protein KDD92_14580 [Caldilineaceae bacterium]|nr:hypothetical protein [Caldilineaceae bacterium]
MDRTCAQSFDWIIYRDATLAGLSALLPLPFLDDAAEERFRKQMPQSIAARRDYDLSAQRLKQINANPINLVRRIKNVALWPIKLPQRFLSRIWRKAVYVFTIRRAVVSLSHYWQRAFLIDYMICSGYLEDDETAQAAIAAMRTILEEREPDTLTELAVDTLRAIPGVSRLARSGLSSLRKRDEEAEELDRIVQQFMRNNWSRYATYFDRLADQYDEGVNERLAAGRTMSRTA